MLTLSEEESEALGGAYGETRRKLMQTLVLYAQALEADRLCDIEGPGHLVINDSREGWGARMEFLEEVAAAGLKSRFPLTIDPPAPYRDPALELTDAQQAAMDLRFHNEDRYRELLGQLGLVGRHGATCTPWFAQVGNKPSFGQVVAWAESSAVVFVNSVLGARTHRNAGVVELISNLLGKTPNAGLVTDEGRKADYLIHIDCTVAPDAQALGYLLGRTVSDRVPYLVGLDRYLRPLPDRDTLQYLHDLGTNCAVGGGVGLFHVENITPEAERQGRALLRPDSLELEIGSEQLAAATRSIRSGLKVDQIRPDRCLVGCPHLTLEQLHAWTENIDRALQQHGRQRLAVDTILVAAPPVVRAFREQGDAYARLAGCGVRLSSFCLEGLMQDRAIAPRAVVTNSNKLRHYNTGVYLFSDEELVQIIVTGSIGQGTSDAS